MAKGLNNGAVPMGAVVCKNEIYDTVVNGAPATAIRVFHGYTYTGHPIAAAAITTLDVYQDEQLFERAAQHSRPISETKFTNWTVTNTLKTCVI